ncbi:hypothetical protein H9Q73_011047 [Fusarium xylarioides]|nr:hypothetical protein H9Q73_011047 [Fusarium xylarioides]
MPTPQDSGGGCLAVLSSCFKGRDKSQPEDLQPARPTGLVNTPSNPLTPGLEATQQRASTSPPTGDPITQPVWTDGSPSTIGHNEPSSAAQSSNQVSLRENSSEARLDLWLEAYDAAEENTKTWIDENAGEWLETNKLFPELVTLVRNSEGKHDGEAWQFKYNSHPILLRDCTNKVSSCLTAIGDIAINFAPAPSPIIWNAVKVLLKANVSRCEDLASIMGYTDLVLCFVRRGHAKQQLLDVKDLEKDLENTARACEAVANLTRNEKHRQLLESLQLPLRRIDNGVTAVLGRLDEAKKIEIMKYISTIQVGGHHNEKCKSRTEVGTRKSYVSSKIIDRYLVHEGDQENLTSQHDEGFAFFYCYRSDPSRKNTGSILLSYIQQLSEVPRRPDSIHQASLDLYRDGQKVQHGLTLEKCTDTLIKFMNSYPRVTLVLDALDECDDDTKRELVKVSKPRGD